MSSPLLRLENDIDAVYSTIAKNSAKRVRRERDRLDEFVRKLKDLVEEDEEECPIVAWLTTDDTEWGEGDDGNL